MKLTVLSSNSSGNCYLLEAKNSTLILECGVHFSKIKQALNFDYSKVAGCLVSHCHGDHAKSITDVIKAGIEVYSSFYTFGKLGISGRRVNPIIEMETYAIGEFLVKPFPAKHDVDCFGFLIFHKEMGTCLFLTDTYYSEYTFTGLNNIIVEANFCEDIIQRKHQEGSLHTSRHDRIFTSHLSIQSCGKLLKANDLKAVNNIVLIHLSDSNSDAAAFKKTIQELTGTPTHIARPNLSIDFNKTPF